MNLLQYFRLDEGEYMGFGLSGDDERTKMVGGDVTIAWMDHATGKFFLSTYTLNFVWGKNAITNSLRASILSFKFIYRTRIC